MVLSGFSGDEAAWEAQWAPYDPPTYASVLERLHPEDVILEIGAGDLRLARQMAGCARRVIAIERLEDVVRAGIAAGPLPDNLEVWQGDALRLEFPQGVTAGVLLMRHCRHFRRYAEKLKSCGCERLITNARWRMDVEEVWLLAPRQEYGSFELGWYACWCGAAGFKPGMAERLTPEVAAMVHEVTGCPRCRPRKLSAPRSDRISENR